MLDATIDTRDVERGLRALVRAGRDIAPVLQQARKPLRTDQRTHQREQRGPDGPWPRVAASTQRKRGRTKSGRWRRKRTLGKLPGLLSIGVSGRDTLFARSRVSWAYVHQVGGRVGRGARIAARPFLYFGREFVDDVEQAVAAFLAGEWTR